MDKKILILAKSIETLVTRELSNNDLLDSQGYPIIKQYQAKKAVYKKEIIQETITEVYDVSRAVVDPDTQQYVYDIKTDASGNTLYVEKYEMKYIVVSPDKYSVYNDKEVFFLPRHGRGHFISPSNINFRANIDALKQLGVTDIVSVSAVLLSILLWMCINDFLIESLNSIDLINTYYPKPFYQLFLTNFALLYNYSVLIL